MLIVIMQSFIMLSVIMPTAMVIAEYRYAYCYPQCHYVKRHHINCNGEVGWPLTMT
jgi:hypothetical protein